MKKLTDFNFESTPPKRILVITRRYLGDTLLVTPLLSALRQAYPVAEIDVLLTSSNVGMLENNSDIHQLIPVASKPNLWAFVSQLFRLFRRYDLAISTQTGDRPTLYAAFAGKFSVGFVPAKPKSGWRQRFILNAWLEFSLDQSHALLGNLRFCSFLNIDPCYQVTPPRSQTPVAAMPRARFAVMHIMPQWRYKQWRRQGWLEVADFLHRQGYQIVLTGSRQQNELDMINAIAEQLPDDTVNLAGQLSLGQLTTLIEHAELFIGPDTGITHLAAATGTKTFAIFGPTSPRKWGPWPKNYANHTPPFTEQGSQQAGNVYLIQGTTIKGCIPCQQEGCEKNRFSYSECLDNLSAENVIATISTAIQPIALNQVK